MSRFNSEDFSEQNTIGVVAPSFVVSTVELAAGVNRIRNAGFDVRVHPQCRKRHFFFAGDDQARAEAFFEFAWDPSVQVIWCARGGYGSTRLLPILERMAAEWGTPPRKLLVGYSDATALLEFTRSRWGWESLHAPMPGLRDFLEIPEKSWKSITEAVRGNMLAFPWEKKRLKWIGGRRPSRAISGQVVGGNLTVWTTMTGTVFAPSVNDKIFFLEDTGESLYRLDRYCQQLAAAGGLKGVKALVLGTYHLCDDIVPRGWARLPADEVEMKRMELAPLRPRISPKKALEEIFGSIGRELGIPVAVGLPVGHGKGGETPLPLGAKVELRPDGQLKLLRWEWFR